MPRQLNFGERYISTDAGSMRMLSSRNRQGFDIVLVHGLIVSASFMEPTAKHLAQKHRVFLPDLLGHGKSETPKKALTIKEHAQLLTQALKTIKVKNPVIVGGSYGCQVAVETANLLDTSALIFVGPTPGAEFKKAFADLYTDAFHEPPELVLRVLLEVARIGLPTVLELLDDMVDYPFHERLCNLKMPTLVITGEHDPFFSPDFINETAEILPISQGICVPDKAHGLPFSEPEIIGDFINNFLAHTFDQSKVA